MKKTGKKTIVTRIIRREINPDELDITGNGSSENPFQIEAKSKNLNEGWNASVKINNNRIITIEGTGDYRRIVGMTDWVKDVALEIVKAKILYFTLHVTEYTD